MTDRELLEAAARAAAMWPQDFELGDDNLPLWDEVRGFRMAFGVGWWHPDNDDGDALRLAVKLCIDVKPPRTEDDDAQARQFEHLEGFFEPQRYSDAASATRRAIVRAAAAIGAQR